MSCAETRSGHIELVPTGSRREEGCGLVLNLIRDRVAQLVEQRTSDAKSGQKEPRAGRSGTAMSGCRNMLERPESRPHHNVAGNGMRDGLKSERIG